MHDQTLTMIPGPTPVHARILDELAKPTVSHVAPGFVETYRRCLADLKSIGCAERAHPFVIAGAGTLAMEMALVNLVGPGDRMLVVSAGYFGDRWLQLAEAFGLRADVLRADWGRIVDPDAVRRKIREHDYAAVTMTHVDTSTGAASPVRDYCDVLRGGETLAIVDGVCATAGMEERMDDWRLDLLLTGAQKAFGAPPGLAILLASERAMARRRSRATIPAYYADLLRWQPIMENPALYFSTPAVNSVWALAEAMRLVLEEGLPQRFARHARIARAVRAGLAAVGLVSFTAADCLADTLTVARYPAGVDDAKFRGAMASHKVVVAGALGSIAGQAFRVGHMGNIDAGEVCRLLEAVEYSLAAVGHPARAGAAIAAAAPHLVSGH